jgi:type II secretory pathway pseudopilin PulG
MSAVAIAIAAVSVAAAGLGYSVYAGEQGKKAQEQAMRQQKLAQDQAAREARTQTEASMAAMRAANRRTPDVSGIMQAAQESAQGGPSSTMLTGPMGVNPQDLQLGRSSLLGG